MTYHLSVIARRGCCRILFTLLVLIGIFATPQAQAEDLDYSAFRSLPVLHEGRIRPLENFARSMLKAYAGKETFENRPAVEWLAETLFDPAQAASRKIFRISSESVKTQLGLPLEEDFFSLIDVQDAVVNTRGKAVALLQEKNRTPEQEDFLRLHDHVETYNQLLRSLSLILPLGLEPPNEYWNEPVPPAYLDLVAAEQRMAAKVRGIVARKGADPKSYTPEEQALTALSFQLATIRDGGAASRIFKIMPGSWGENPEWFSPWALLLSGEGSPKSREYLQLWRNMAEAYRAGDAAAWRAATEAAQGFIFEEQSKTLSPFRLKLEQIYTAVKPYLWAMGFYALTIILLSIYFFPVRFAQLSMMIAIGIHTAAIAARVIILERPPVGTLYESLLFVALVVAVLGFILSRVRKTPVPALTAALAALGLLAATPFTGTDSGNLDVLSAVLNTNFWLGTHVLVITAGYGLCILSAMLAHAWMIERLRSGEKPQSLYTLAYQTSLATLLFTAVGTILGGIWADHSWGRFWGWDPKENGALLIVLWLIWAQHGRLSGHLRDLPFMAALAFLNVVVALAWFGVNLLSVGLHSYGFTSGIAGGLAAFCAAEILLISGLWAAIRRKNC